MKTSKDTCSNCPFRNNCLLLITHIDFRKLYCNRLTGNGAYIPRLAKVDWPNEIIEVTTREYAIDKPIVALSKKHLIELKDIYYRSLNSN